MFYIFIFLLCSFSLTNSAPIFDNETNVECGISDALNRYNTILHNENRIMGGVVSPSHYWPWLAALMHPKEAENPTQYCTGEIIGSRWIITAKHCQNVIKGGFFNVGTNDDNQVSNGTKYEIKTYYLPPGDFDIALVELSEDLEYKKDISPICISKSVNPKIGDLAVVAGFGRLFIEYDASERTGVDSEKTNVLHEGLVTVENVTECAKKIRVKDGQICAGGVNRGVMEGDSGGPIMGIKDNKFYLYGAVSGGHAYRVGEDNLTVDELDTYTIVSLHCDWIEEMTKGGVKCET